MFDLSRVENSLGVSFADKTLLQRALTHRSYLNENPDVPWEDNERLEFLGDAILDFVIGEYLYHRFPEMREGGLTSLRAALVRTETLASFAKRLGLGRHILMGRGEADSGGRERPAILCAAFEAVVGALYLDQGLAAVQEFVQRLTEPELNRILEEKLVKDAKSQLQELSQGRLRLTPVYRTVAERGPDHAKEFTVEVLIGDEVYGRGVGRSKHAAEEEAAKEALARLRRWGAAEAGGKLPGPIWRALLTLMDALRGLRWVLAGSVASALNGLPVEPRDIDILTDKAEAGRIAEALADFAVEPLAWRETPQYASYLGRFRVEGVEVEVIGDLIIKGRGCTLTSALYARPRRVSVADESLLVVPLEAQLIANFFIGGKEERVRQIAAHLKAHGYDKVLLRQLLAEQELPESIVEEIWGLLADG